jgi:hypothetical protein
VRKWRKWSVRRIHEIQKITQAETYLEVGVADGDTFFGVDLPYKDAVDPAFGFDHHGRGDDRVRFFEMPSDRFFASHLPRPRYDIVFLDGLHTFEQTLRDFLATLPLSHEKTVWLIDDTVPSDAYSALRDRQHCYRERAKAAGSLWDLKWHGDVYKVVYAIHDLCPNLNYATIKDDKNPRQTGNPQTIVWREPRESFSPAFATLEDVSRATYFDMECHTAAMRIDTEEGCLATLGRALARTPA